MKKQYINPVLTVINVQTQQMIAESQTVNFGSGTKGGGEAVSRRGYNVWDDEDEFDSEE